MGLKNANVVLKHVQSRSRQNKAKTVQLRSNCKET